MRVLNRALRCRRSSLPPWRPKRQARPGRSASLDRERSVSLLEDCSQVPERCLLGWREEFCLFFPLSFSPDPSTPFFHLFLVSAVSAPYKHARAWSSSRSCSFFLSLFPFRILVLAPFIMPLSIGGRPELLTILCYAPIPCTDRIVALAPKQRTLPLLVLLCVKQGTDKQEGLREFFFCS